MIRIIKDLLKKLKLFYVIKIISSFSIQIASLFLIYILPPAEFGYLALIISASQLMYILTSGWSNGAIINLGSKKFAEIGNYNNIVFYRTIIVLISLLIISLLFYSLETPISKFILKNENYELVYYLYLGYVLYDFSAQLLYPGNKDLTQSISELITSISLLLLTIMFVRSIKNYIFIYSVIYILFSLFIISVFIYYYGKQKFSWDKKEFVFLFKYSLWQLLSVISIYLINIGVNYMFIYYELSVIDIGLYNFSYRMFSGFAAFFALFGVIIPKWIHNSDKKVLSKLLETRIFYSICLLVFLYLIVGLILEPFIVFIGKEDYLESIKYFIYLFPAFIFMCYSNLINTVIMNSSYYKKAQLAIVAQGLSLIISSFFLVGIFGIYGAIISTTISFIIGAIYLYFLYTRKVKKNFLLEKEW